MKTRVIDHLELVDRVESGEGDEWGPTGAIKAGSYGGLLTIVAAANPRAAAMKRNRHPGMMGTD
jgi:hypothetical protein